jgi:hypothetical protein
VIKKNRQIKEAKVAEIKEKLEKAQGVVLASYQGLTVEEDTMLRKSLREAGVEYKLTYEMPDIKDEITQALSEITETILTFYEEHKTVARVIMVVSILFLAGLATYSFLSTSAGIALLTAIKAGLLQLLPIWISQF